MFDGIKILDLSVSADRSGVPALRTHDRLLFPLSLDEQTGAVLDRPRRANDQGLTFTLTPTLTGDRVRCELQGSLHRYGRGGRHNADQFTASDLLATLDRLVSTYGINPFASRLNNVEFGVNVSLPFPVGQVLDNLISYKYRPFTKEPGDGFAYYQAVTQRYIVKLYDKGHQYRTVEPELPGNVLRVEVKVLKMAYLRSQRVRLDTLADLLLTDNYGALGALLVEIFTEILFDEPTINPAALTIRERDVYQNGRNPRFWSIPDHLTRREYDRCQKSFKRTEQTFRALLNQYRQGDDWQSLTAALIGQTWQRLSAVDDDLLTRISERRAAWADLTVNRDKTVMEGSGNSNKTVMKPTANRELTGNLQSDAGRETVEKCPLLTGSDDDRLRGGMSVINPLSIALTTDNAGSQTTDRSGGRGTVPAAPANRRITGVKSCLAEGPPAAALSPVSVSQNGEETARPTASVLRSDAALLASVEQRRRRYAKGSKEDEPNRAAHNLRNDDSNPRNNLARRLRRLLDTSTGRPLTLFSPAEVVRLTPDQRVALDHWQGTRYEIRL